jgi:hypothetical protein
MKAGTFISNDALEVSMIRIRSLEAEQVLKRRLAWALLAAASLSGCATMGPAAVAPGSARSQVEQRLGTPTAVHELRTASADSPYLQVDTTGRAVRRVEYAGGSFGKFTWMFDFDAEDRLLASAQVRSEARFNAITAGMSQQDLRRVLGAPSRIWPLSFQKQNVWAYRYDSPFCQWFQVGVGYDGRVIDTAYGPDPLCDDDTLGGVMRGPRFLR